MLYQFKNRFFLLFFCFITTSLFAQKKQSERLCREWQPVVIEEDGERKNERPDTDKRIEFRADNSIIVDGEKDGRWEFVDKSAQQLKIKIRNDENIMDIVQLDDKMLILSGMIEGRPVRLELILAGTSNTPGKIKNAPKYLIGKWRPVKIIYDRDGEEKIEEIDDKDASLELLENGYYLKDGEEEATWGLERDQKSLYFTGFLGDASDWKIKELSKDKMVLSAKRDGSAAELHFVPFQ